MLRKIPVLKKDVDEWTSFYKVQQTGQSASALKTAKISDYKMFSADRIEAELANVMTEYKHNARQSDQQDQKLEEKERRERIRFEPAQNHDIA